MPNNDFALRQETIVNKEKTNCKSACIFLQLRYNVSTLTKRVLSTKG